MDQEVQQGPQGRSQGIASIGIGIGIGAGADPDLDAGAQQVFEELLVTLAMSGDAAATGRLALRWQPRLLRTARRYLGEDQLAQGAVQDTWIAILRGLVWLRDPARFAPWAFGILRRRCADKLRRRVKDRGALGEMREFPADPAAEPGEALSIAQAFASLPPDQRLAAQLFFVEGLSLAEISEASAVPAGTVKSRLFHARRKLKAALSGDDQ